MREINKIVFGFFVLIFLVLSLISYVVFNEYNNDHLSINFLDIGQGDSILIQKNSYDIVVDGGPDNTLVYKLGKFIPFYDRHIDLLILTHPDSDHLMGFPEILKRYKVTSVLLVGVYDDLPAYQEFLKIIKDQNINILIAGDVRHIKIDQETIIDIFYPLESLEGQLLENNNDHSLVFKLSYKNFSTLFTGDATKVTEEIILENNFDVSSDILKIGHHGSNTSSGKEFLEKVNPKLAIILVGENRFGHPSEKVTKRLEDLKIKYLDTEKNGEIIIRSDGNEFFDLDLSN